MHGSQSYLRDKVQGKVKQKKKRKGKKISMLSSWHTWIRTASPPETAHQPERPVQGELFYWMRAARQKGGDAVAVIGPWEGEDGRDAEEMQLRIPDIQRFHGNDTKGIGVVTLAKRSCFQMTVVFFKKKRIIQAKQVWTSNYLLNLIPRTSLGFNKCHQ